jgi:hypothetical protein
MITTQDLSTLLPIVTEWANTQEAHILKNGVPLDDDQQIDAYLIGVKNITKVRILKVNKIPVPGNSELSRFIEESRLISPRTIGFAFRYGILIRSDFWNNRKLMIHELCHTMQVERAGNFEKFLEEYLTECITHGYPKGPLEQEARRFETEISAR